MLCVGDLFSRYDLGGGPMDASPHQVFGCLGLLEMTQVDYPFLMKSCFRVADLALNQAPGKQYSDPLGTICGFVSENVEWTNLQPRVCFIEGIPRMVASSSPRNNQG